MSELVKIHIYDAAMGHVIGCHCYRRKAFEDYMEYLYTEYYG